MGSIALIEKAIGTSDLGLTPTTTASVIRINIPPLTEERRKELCKIASKVRRRGQGGPCVMSAAMRLIRSKNGRRDGELSEDLSRDEQDRLQKVTDKFIADLRETAF